MEQSLGEHSHRGMKAPRGRSVPTMEVTHGH